MSGSERMSRRHYIENVSLFSLGEKKHMCMDERGGAYFLNPVTGRFFWKCNNYRMRVRVTCLPMHFLYISYVFISTISMIFARL